MKNTLRKSCLLGLSLLLVLSIAGFVGVTSGQVVINTQPNDLHQSSLYWLYLSGADGQDSWLNDGSYESSFSEKFLSVLYGLIIGKEHNPNSSQLVVIGGGQNNTLNADHTGIGGGFGNRVSAEDGAIGGGTNNTVGGKGGVVAGGRGNTNNSEFGVVLGGQGNGNNGEFGVILGGLNNRGGSDSLILGSGANGGNDSFSWSQTVGNNVAGIRADNGVLIGTYDAIQGVALVVNGAVKLGKEQEPTQKGEINSKDGCLKVYDGTSKHILGKTSESESGCGAGKGCQFGKTMLQDGDVITTSSSATLKAYSAPYAINCEEKRISVTCNDGNLGSNVYSYCYNIDDKPILD